jgi:hypothetical protein
MGRLSKLDRFVPGRGRKLMVAVAVIALIALPVSNVLANHVFSDVPTSAFYHSQVTAIANAGITGGCGGTKYCPNNFVTRGQMAVFLDRIGNLSDEHGPVVDALTLNGYILGPAIEQYTLVGGAVRECQDAVPLGLDFQTYALVYTVYGVPATMTTDEVIVSLIDIDDPDGDYQVCFRRVAGGNLVAGNYDVYAIGGAVIGEGIFAGAGSASSQNKTARFQQSRIGK